MGTRPHQTTITIAKDVNSRFGRYALFEKRIVRGEYGVQSREDFLDYLLDMYEKKHPESKDWESKPQASNDGQ